MEEEVPHPTLGYQHQPRYTEAEILERRRARRAAEEVALSQPVMQSQPVQPAHDDETERRLNSTSWCNCGHCLYVPNNATLRMCVCCQEQQEEFEGLRDKLDHRDYSCITSHEDFRAICLTDAVLEMMAAFMRDRRGYDMNQEWSHRLYRLLSYQSYTYWIHQRLGKKNRRVIPACVVNTIRERWPEADPTTYVSYKEADDEIQDAWAI
ncbi:uncharacterized protein [Amphiura filiformis]|uniref:uncharacterized protein n=1 Tax=Amphiura filiformis TaxID=82378 RepID=UPI003B228A8F